MESSGLKKGGFMSGPLYQGKERVLCGEGGPVPQPAEAEQRPGCV